MKKITKIFTTIVVAFAAYSCVADATEDLGVQLGSGEGLTSITLSLGEPDTKVQFGTKDGDTYPLYWNNGDVIGVNLVESSPLTGVAENTKTATFTFETANVGKYGIGIGYPVPDEPADTNKRFVFVEIPAVQQYYKDNIDPKAMVLWGHADSYEVLNGVTLEAAVGVLRIAIKGNGEVLKDLTVETLSEYLEYNWGSTNFDNNTIAGQYAVVHCPTDSTPGVLVPRKDVSKLITVNLPEEGLTLGEEEQVVYVALRKGSYGTIKVTLTDADGGQMAVTFDSDAKPIKEGIVREFGALEFKANVESGDEPVATETLEIKNEADIVTFAKNAGNYKSAVVKANLDMSNISAEDLAYFPIDGFNGTEFDGGSAEDYTISNLTTPLFDTTSANIKNVNLVDVAIVSNNTPVMGALANSIVASNDSSVVENCSATGTLTINNPNYTIVKSDSPEELVYGGLVGKAYGATFTNCTNDIDITASMLSDKSVTDKLTYATIGGVVGYMYNQDSILSSSSQCTNNGDIVVNDTTTAGDTSVTEGEVTTTTYGHKARVLIGGVIANTQNSQGATFNELTNNGSISVSSTLVSGANIIGGVIGSASHESSTLGSITNATNNGAITITSAKTSALRIAGVCFALNGNSGTNLYNNGAITIGAQEAYTDVASRIDVSGIVGNANDNGATIDTAANNAPITIYANNASCSGFRVAGVALWSKLAVNNLTNSANGDITINGTYTITGADSSNECCVSGVIAAKTVGATTAPIINNGDIIINASFNGSSSTGIKVGGTFGALARAASDVTNNGDITINGNNEETDFSVATVRVGGCFGASSSGYDRTNVTNNGDVTIGTGVVMNSNLYLGGVVGHDTGTKTLQKASNTGAISVGAQTYNARIGGVAGSSTSNIATVSNSGDITHTGSIPDRNNHGIFIGGVASSIAGTVDGATNTGNITCQFVGDTHNVYAVGGVFCSSKSTNIANATNGALTANGTPDDTKGKISMLSSGGSLSYLASAGLICLSTGENATYTDCNNYGNLLVDKPTGLGYTTNYGTAAGLSVYACNTATWNNCHNHGDITVGEKANIYRGVAVGGLFASFNSATSIRLSLAKADINTATESNQTLIGCSNNGDINILGSLVTYNKGEIVFDIGGIVGEIHDNGALTIQDGFVNSGKITFGGKLGTTQTSDKISIGGLVGSSNNTNWDNSNWSGTITNTEAITYSTVANTDAGVTSAAPSVYVGGVFGKMVSAVAAPVVNTGMLSFSGTYGDAYVGGIVGNTTSTVTGARCYCGINADDTAKLGWITGSARSATVKATNCAIGGYTLVHDIENEIDKVVPAFTTSNYYDYIYGGTTDWTGVTDYDGCGYLSSKDAEVEYPAATE